METNLLFYKIRKGTVTSRDYINWSYSLLRNEISSPSLNILSSCSFSDNLFEIESYFKRSLKELAIKEPTFEACARAHVVTWFGSLTFTTYFLVFQDRAS